MSITDAMLKKLLNDPTLIKTLEKLAKAAPKIAKDKKLKELGNPAHVNKVIQKCRLCKSSSIVYLRMDWDPADKLFRSGCHHLDNIWPSLPLYEMTQGRPSCACCYSTLIQLEKEDLVKKLITLAERN